MGMKRMITAVQGQMVRTPREEKQHTKRNVSILTSNHLHGHGREIGLV